MRWVINGSFMEYLRVSSATSRSRLGADFTTLYVLKCSRPVHYTTGQTYFPATNQLPEFTCIMTNLSQEELDGIYAFAVDLGKRAGQMLTDAAQIRIDGGSATPEQKEHVQKENAVDLVTETDEGECTVEAYCLHG
jgi:hypothetical protein